MPVLNTHGNTAKSIKSCIVVVMFGSSKISLQHMWSYTRRVVIQESSIMGICTIDLRVLRHLCEMKQALKHFADPGAKCALVKVYIRKAVNNKFKPQGLVPSCPVASVVRQILLFMNSQGMRAVLHVTGRGRVILTYSSCLSLFQNSFCSLSG